MKIYKSEKERKYMFITFWQNNRSSISCLAEVSLCKTLNPFQFFGHCSVAEPPRGNFLTVNKLLHYYYYPHAQAQEEAWGQFGIYTDRRETWVRKKSCYHSEDQPGGRKPFFTSFFTCHTEEFSPHIGNSTFLIEGKQSLWQRYKEGKKGVFSISDKTANLETKFWLWRSPPQACRAFKITEGQLFHYRE